MTFDYFKLSDIFSHYTDNVNPSLPFKTFVVDERKHAYVVAENINDALINFKSVHDRLWNKYEPLFDFYDNDLSDLMKLDHKITTHAEDDTIQVITDEATEDSSINKINETPDAGNIDLTDDTFISESSRTNVSTGERNRINEHERELQEERIETDNIRRLEAIANINNKILDLEGLFLKELDREILVFKHY